MPLYTLPMQRIASTDNVYRIVILNSTFPKTWYNDTQRRWTERVRFQGRKSTFKSATVVVASFLLETRHRYPSMPGPVDAKLFHNLKCVYLLGHVVNRAHGVRCLKHSRRAR